MIAPGRILFACLLGCALVAAPCQAAPDDGPEQGMVVTLQNGKGKDGKPKGSFFSVEGTCPPLKNGTQLEVTFAAVGSSRLFPVKILRAVVQGNRYAVSFPWPDRVFAPLVYQVTVELRVRKQAPAIQRWIMDEYGYSQLHRETIDRKRMPFASEGERAAFAIENNERICQFVRDIETSGQGLKALAEKPAAETENFGAQYTVLRKSLLKCRRSIDSYFRGYVILLEQGFYNQLLLQVRSLAHVLRAHKRGEPGATEWLEGQRSQLATLLAAVKQYAPVATEEPLVDDEDDEQQRSTDKAREGE